MDYTKYLATSHWKKRKQRIKELRGNICFICESQKNIHIHHIQYEDKNGVIFGRERDHHLIPLCASCHQKFHAVYKTKRLDLQFFKRAKVIYKKTFDFTTSIRYAFNRQTYKAYMELGILG